MVHSFAAMAVRRELDDAKDCRSLKLLLDQIAREPDVAYDFSAQRIPVPELRAHKRELVDISSRVLKIGRARQPHKGSGGARSLDRRISIGIRSSGEALCGHFGHVVISKVRFLIRTRLKAASPKVNIQSTRSRPRCRVLRMNPTVLSHPKISSTRFRRR